MTVIRLILLVAVLGGITLLLLQNLSPGIPLVFLGLRTLPLSLAIWILLSTAAGGFTSLAIAGLLRLVGGKVTQQRQTTPYSPPETPRVKKPTSRENESYANPTPPVGKVQVPPAYENTENTEDTYDDDWDLDRKVNDNWDFEESTREFEEREYRESDSRQYTKIQDDAEYEDFPEQVNDYKSADSTYSYDKGDLKDSNIGKTESVYDADYRVIVPPADPSPIPNSSDNSDNKNNDDDWDFLEDDFDSDKREPRW